ncbi:hypothetical protein F8M41_002512 [Gigaspora margarita]|uniref:Uncharacterized protein n=1 Tax=Gigaspora margarita TaxID=4874 RepID=A0A8H3XE67_GIGMA|nr:hypothetical protein F8M41_002512 [Gigaspora margarita]
MMTNSNNENFPQETYNKKRRENIIYPTCIRNEKQFKGQLNVLVSFNKRDKPWQWMPLRSLKYGQQLLRNFRIYKARQRRKQEYTNLKSNEMNSIDKTMVWENEMRFDQETFRSNIDEEDRVSDFDRDFYPNYNEQRADGMIIDKDSWSENVEMGDIENEGNERPITNVASNDRFIIDVMVPLYQKLLKIVENGSNDMDSITSLCGNGTIGFYQDQQKLNGDYNKSTYYLYTEGDNKWNNFNMNFEHAETDGIHNSNNQLQNHSPDSQNHRDSLDHESSTKFIPIYNDINNNGLRFPTYHHYNETNDKGHLTENYNGTNKSQQQSYTTSWYTTYTNVIEEKSWNKECSNETNVSFNDTDGPPTTRVSIENNDFQYCYDFNNWSCSIKERTDEFCSVGDSVLKFNPSWAPWKDKDDFDNELDKLLKNFKAEVTDRLTNEQYD